jgi:hypothetical protein
MPAAGNLRVQAVREIGAVPPAEQTWARPGPVAAERPVGDGPQRPTTLEKQGFCSAACNPLVQSPYRVWPGAGGKVPSAGATRCM